MRMPYTYTTAACSQQNEKPRARGTHTRYHCNPEQHEGLGLGLGLPRGPRASHLFYNAEHTTYIRTGNPTGDQTVLAWLITPQL